VDAGYELTSRAVEFPRTLQEGLCVSPKLEQRLPGEERLSTMFTLRAQNHVFLAEIENAFADRTTITLRLLVERRIHINKNETVRQFFPHYCGIKRLPALRALCAFVFCFAVCGSAHFIFDWGKT
jgi:hypothetical protein